MKVLFADGWCWTNLEKTLSARGVADLKIGGLSHELGRRRTGMHLQLRHGRATELPTGNCRNFSNKPDAPLCVFIRKLNDAVGTLLKLQLRQGNPYRSHFITSDFPLRLKSNPR